MNSVEADLVVDDDYLTWGNVAREERFNVRLIKKKKDLI